LWQNKFAVDFYEMAKDGMYFKGEGTVKLAELPTETLEKIKQYRYDRIIEKHEGPMTWEAVLRFYDPEFIHVNSYDVLLPVGRAHHPNITFLRCIVGDGGTSLTLFLKDTTYVDNPEDERLFAGFLAVCDQMPGEAFFIAVVYHEWFIVENRIGTI
jgi:hypothetical protein